MRYRGQAFELMIPAGPVAGPIFDRATLDGLVAGFHETHRQRFSYANPGAAVEIVSLRVSAIGRLPMLRGAVASQAEAAGRNARQRTIWLGGRWREVAAWSRSAIAPGTLIEGPALIEEAYTTVLIADGWHCRRHPSGHLVAART
jgi:N-methylhydantoinase A/oxoprolinase/acetone carboxylase beta subunit